MHEILFLYAKKATLYQIFGYVFSKLLLAPRSCRVIIDTGKGHCSDKGTMYDLIYCKTLIIVSNIVIKCSSRKFLRLSRVYRATSFFALERNLSLTPMNCANRHETFEKVFHQNQFNLHPKMKHKIYKHD